MRKLNNMKYSTGMELYEMLKARHHDVELRERSNETFDIYLNNKYLDSFDAKNRKKRGFQYLAN